MTNQPSISIFDIRVDEPVIAATDLLVAGVCFYAYFKLSQTKGSGKAFNLFKLYFLLLGLATTWGSLVTHAFFYFFNDAWRTPGWIVGIIAIALMALAMIEFVREIMDTRMRFILTYLVLAEFVFVASATVLTLHFRWTGIHSAFVLLGIVTPLSVWAWKKRNDNTPRLLLLGVLFFCLSGVIFTLQLSPHIWFNHIDLAHVFLTLAIYFFYRGTLFLREGFQHITVEAVT